MGSSVALFPGGCTHAPCDQVVWHQSREGWDNLCWGVSECVWVRALVFALVSSHLLWVGFLQFFCHYQLSKNELPL